MTSAEVSAWLGEDLPPRTDRSKGLGALLTELEDIRRSGFAYDDEEHTEGVSAISVSIGTYRGAYAITIIAPTARLHSKMRRGLHRSGASPPSDHRTAGAHQRLSRRGGDRKSTRLNSRH